MKYELRRIGLRIIAALLFGSLSLQANAENFENVKFYEIKEGRIDYKVSGINNGTESMEWNHWGRKSIRRTKATMQMMGITQSIDQLMYTDGKWVYNVDQTANTATKMESPMLKNVTNRKDLDMIKVGTDFMKAMGGKIVGTETILGKKCDVWEMKQIMSKTCVWRGIPLKTIAGMPGMEVTQTAVDIILGSVPDSRVSLPSNVKVVKQIDPFKHMKGMEGLGHSKDIGKGRPGSRKTMPKAQDMQKMLEHLKKMQEQMQQQE